MEDDNSYKISEKDRLIAKLSPEELKQYKAKKGELRKKAFNQTLGCLGCSIFVIIPCWTIYLFVKEGFSWRTLGLAVLSSGGIMMFLLLYFIFEGFSDELLDVQIDYLRAIIAERPKKIKSLQRLVEVLELTSLKKQTGTLE